MTVKLTLTIPQIDFFRAEIRDGQSMGDCKLSGLTLVMEDYDGANSMVRRFMQKSHTTTREYTTWNSVVDRLNVAIAKAAGK